MLCRMDNFEGVKNWFLASCYSLVVRIGLVSLDWEDHSNKSQVSWSGWNLNIGILGLSGSNLFARH